ncbi:MAG TPA: class I SAM-dependent methyltransferase [Solirubrobacteraceae bacterium]
MDAGQPSRTALATAAARAAHLIVDQPPWIFEDGVAALLLGELAEEHLAPHRDAGSGHVLGSMRVAMTARSRYTEACLADACDRGVDQYVLLGAGLDSFACRSPLTRRLRVFEVDHPATQAWKRERLAAAGIPLPDEARLVAVDFRTDSLRDRLAEAGFDHSQPAFVSWLGVTQYLPGEAIAATLDVIARLCPGTELAMEYLVPAELRDEPGTALADFYIPRAAGLGEPWLSFLTPDEVAALLTARDMVVVDDVGRRDQVEPSLWERSDGLCPHELGRVVRAVLRPARPRR